MATETEIRIASQKPIEAHCELLPWDSTFFGMRIARATVNRLTEVVAGDLLRWCAANEVDCLYFLADSDHPPTVALAEDLGFRLMDVRVTLERRLEVPFFFPVPITGGRTRSHASIDIPALRRIASACHFQSRFYADPRFERERCNELYATWIEKSCRGYADEVLVALVDDSPAGYISCHLGPQDSGRIGLAGVDPKSAGQGLGSELVDAALSWFGQRGAKRVEVTTQGRNCVAQRLYQKRGFVTRSLDLWYHKWFDSAGQQ